MIVDVTGVVLVPGNGGRDCPGNGETYDAQGHLIECCCDEWDDLLCCVAQTECSRCRDGACPRNKQ